MNRTMNPEPNDANFSIRDDLQVANLSGINLHFIREILVDLSDGVLCTATLVLDSNQVCVTTRQPISVTDFWHIKQRLQEQSIPYQSKETKITDLQASINGQSERDYQYAEKSANLLQPTVVPIRLKNNTIGALFVASFDTISLRLNKLMHYFSKDASRALRHLFHLYLSQKEKFQSMAAALIDGVLLCDHHKRILFINNKARNLLRMNSDDDLLGKSVDYLPYSFISEYLENAANESIFEVNHVAGADGKRSNYIGVHIELLKNSKNKEIGWLIILRDVSKNWQYDQIRAAIQAASHEINAPLASMQGALDLLLDKDLGELNGNQEHCLNVLKDDISRLRRMLEEVLDLSKLEQGIQFLDRRKEVKLSYLVNHVAESLASYAKSKSIQIENQVSHTIPAFRSDRDRLKQVLANLVENGIKYSLPNGQVTVGAELEKRKLKVWVKDDGVGIPATEFEHIFNRFEQLDNCPDQDQRGYGLGLSVAREIVQSFSGEIWVESEVGVGSRFYFTLMI